MKPFWFFLFFLLAAGAPAGALELQGGRLKIVLYEKTGGFNVYYRTPESEKPYAPFLSDQNPASSCLALTVGGKASLLGPGAGFEQRAAETPLGAAYTWLSPEVIVTESFSIIAEDAVKITLKLSNVSGKDLFVGAGYLFDTATDASAGAPFETDGLGPLGKETVVDARRPITYWIAKTAPAGRNGAGGFRVIVNGASVTPPDRIIFSQWQRLYDNIWELAKIGGKEFVPALVPIVDSAVYQGYDASLLPKNAAREVVLVIESVDQQSTASRLATRSASGPEEKPQGDADEATAMTAEKMEMLNNLLDEVNKKIKQGEAFSPSDYDRIISLLEEISRNPEKEYADLMSRLSILNNLLEVINSMIASGNYSATEIQRLNEIMQRLEQSEAQ